MAAMELVACAGQAAQPKTLEGVMGLEVSKAHLDSLSLVASAAESLGSHLGTRHIAGVLVEIAHDPGARPCSGSTPDNRARKQSSGCRCPHSCGGGGCCAADISATKPEDVAYFAIIASRTSGVKITPPPTSCRKRGSIVPPDRRSPLRLSDRRLPGLINRSLLCGK
jgi:hypothetical protein